MTAETRLPLEKLRAGRSAGVYRTSLVYGFRQDRISKIQGNEIISLIAKQERGPRFIEGRRSSVRFLGVVTFAIHTGFVTLAAAQDETGRDDGVPTCRSLSSASRIRANCAEAEEEQTVIRIEREVDVSVGAVELRTRECANEITLDYQQRDTVARVLGVIENETCAASSGSFEIEARVTHENGDTETFVFPETWQREDDRPVGFSADYVIGENVELTRLRTRNLRCMCSDEIEGQDDQTPVSQ